MQECKMKMGDKKDMNLECLLYLGDILLFHVLLGYSEREQEGRNGGERARKRSFETELTSCYVHQFVAFDTAQKLIHVVHGSPGRYCIVMEQEGFLINERKAELVFVAISRMTCE